jgi:hypothetical protein
MMKTYIFGALVILFAITSCEEVIEIKLNDRDPAFVIEGIISKDSACTVRLTVTGNYFSEDEPSIVEDAIITISNGIITEELNYTANGYYRGENIKGKEGTTYELEVSHKGKLYKATSSMPQKRSILSAHYGKSEAQSALNPLGETVFTISCTFRDNLETDDFYMIKYTEADRMIETKYFLLTENSINGGTLEIDDTGLMRFSESIFYDGGEIKIELFSVDENMYNYFLQLSDILFWKNRVVPPTPYNPTSNISGGAQGYFAAWAFDTKTMLLE